MKNYFFCFFLSFVVGFFLYVGLLQATETKKSLEQQLIGINIFGGLGNQMFQYAAIYAYSLEYHKKFYMRGDSQELREAFNIDLKYAPSSFFVYNAMSGERHREVKGQTFVSNDPIGFLNNPNIVMMHGYFQHEDFFKKYEKKIRRLFKFKKEVSLENKKLMDEINSRNAISIHVRRGDYVSLTKNYYLMTPDYYKRAMDYIAVRIKNPHFYIFSNDMGWVKQNIPIDYPHTYVENNTGSQSYNDMRLMSLCQHNIIANSSFSWWGAWLNANPDKIVIAPDIWDKMSNQNSISIVPKNWIILPNNLTDSNNDKIFKYMLYIFSKVLYFEE